jgi:hypothetical protein
MIYQNILVKNVEQLFELKYLLETIDLVLNVVSVVIIVNQIHMKNEKI